MTFPEWCLLCASMARDNSCGHFPGFPIPPIPAPLQRPRNAAQGEGGVVTPDGGDEGSMKYGSEVE